MASGDVVNDLGALATDVTFQPAAGVDVIIKSIASDASASAAVQLTDGTLIAAFVLSTNITPMGPWLNCSIFINNTNYLVIVNSTGGTSVGYTGVEL